MADAPKPLESPALGSGIEDLIQPCGTGIRPARPKAPTKGPTVGVALSGGGFRATFAALGVLRFLADAGLLGNLRYASSVSGGSVANGMLATRWAEVRAGGYASGELDRLVIDPMVAQVAGKSLKTKVIRNVWRTVGFSKGRTDILAWALDDWFYGNTQLEDLDPECRWIINAANLNTGVRFGFERDVLGDYVTGNAPTAGTGLKVSHAVAASAAVPGVLAPLQIAGVPFPCWTGPVELIDGGAYDNAALTPLDRPGLRHVFTFTINAGGVFVTGGYGRIPLVRELTRANSLLYRQSTALRTSLMVERFRAWDSTIEGEQPAWARQGLLFGLATTIEAKDAPAEFAEFVAAHPEERTYKGKDLAFVPTVFDRLDEALLRRLVYRGWWLTGASLARWYPGMARLEPSATPPPLD